MLQISDRCVKLELEIKSAEHCPSRSIAGHTRQYQLCLNYLIMWYLVCMEQLMSVCANSHYVSFSPQMLWFLLNEISTLELRYLTCTLAVSVCQSWAALVLLDSQMAQWLIVRGRFWELKSSTPPWTLGCLLLVYFGKDPERHLLSKIFDNTCVFEAQLRQTQSSCEV